MRKHRLVWRLVPLAVVVVGSCARSTPGPPPVIHVTMKDYGFAVERPIPTGRVVFRARNEGQLEHELVLVAIPADFRLTIRQHLRSGTKRAFPTEAYLPRRGAGVEGTFAVDLEEGRFAVMCFVVDPDGQNHARKGMHSEFEVS